MYLLCNVFDAGRLPCQAGSFGRSEGCAWLFTSTKRSSFSWKNHCDHLRRRFVRPHVCVSSPPSIPRQPLLPYHRCAQRGTLWCQARPFASERSIARSAPLVQALLLLEASANLFSCLSKISSAVPLDAWIPLAAEGFTKVARTAPTAAPDTNLTKKNARMAFCDSMRATKQCASGTGGTALVAWQQGLLAGDRWVASKEFSGGDVAAACRHASPGTPWQVLVFRWL
jgi:hypothetical protein